MQRWRRLSRKQKAWRLLNLAVIAVLLWALVVDGIGFAVDLLILVAIVLWLPLMFRRAARRSDFGTPAPGQDQTRDPQSDTSERG